MRSIQRGLTTTFIILIILGTSVAIAFVYFTSIEFQKQKTSQINSFETCAKLYPVMESYPEQCQTPDGKHFTRQLSEEVKQQMAPVPPAIPMKVYKNSEFGYSFSYPANWLSRPGVLENSSPVFESPDIEYYEIFVQNGSRIFVLVQDSEDSLDEIENAARLYAPPSNTDNPRTLEVSRAKLSGVEAVREISTRGMNALTYKLISKQKQYSITCNYRPEDYASYRGCDSVLNTFKLSE